VRATILVAALVALFQDGPAADSSTTRSIFAVLLRSLGYDTRVDEIRQKIDEFAGGL
jgi:hypothetical protein